MLGEQEAILFTVPRGFGTTDRGATGVVATSGASSAAQPITEAVPSGNLIGAAGFWYTWVASEDCHIRIGDANVAACTTSDWPLFKGQEWNRWIRIGIDTHFTVIQELTAGKVYHGRSSQ